MKTCSMLLGCKSQYYENDYTTKCNLQIQCNPYQITNDIFHRTRTKNPQFVWKHKRLWKGFPGDISGKQPACQSRRHKRHRFHPCIENVPWRRALQPTPVSLPGESHGQRSLVGYSAWGHKELGHN